MSQKYCLVLCTCPDEACAVALARRLVEARAVACVNCLPNIKSIYGWQQHIECAEEVLLVMKTEHQLYARVAALIQETHPYELPEVIAIPIEHGAPDYLQWISAWVKNIN